jgi:hypothetical protein
VIRCRYTSDETAQFACDYVDRIGKCWYLRKRIAWFYRQPHFCPGHCFFWGFAAMWSGLIHGYDISMMKIGQKWVL